MISVVVPVSPIKSHPDISILSETVASVRHHLPSSELFLSFDGVRPEQESRREDYEEAIRRILWRADHDPSWGPCVPWIHDQHMHQSGMLRAVIDEIQTELLLYVEADTPLVTDEPIDWETITAFVRTGESNLVRMHHEARIPEAHAHMVHGLEYDHRVGRVSKFLRTSQWSQRPHIASVAYYRRCLESYFSPEAKSFIEDRMHGVVDEAFKRDGLQGWMQHRLHIYMPGDNIKRSYHLDGRAGEKKFDESQVW